MSTPSVLLLLAAVACAGGDARPGTGLAVRDSGGVRIVENGRPAWAASTQWSLSAEPVLTISSDEADPRQQLFGVVGVEVLSNGTIALANAGTMHLLLYDAAGSFVRQAAGPGEGPGELQLMIGLFGCGGDTLVVNSLRSLHFFDAAGDFQRSEAVATTAPGTGHMEPFGLSPDCSQSFLTRVGAVRHDDRGSSIRPATLFRATAPGSAPDSVTTLGYGEFVGLDFGGRMAARPLPWSAWPVWTVAGARVVVGPSDRHELFFYGDDGLAQIVRWPGEPPPVTVADHEAYTAARDRVIERSPEGAAGIAALAAFRSLPATKPAYSRILADDEGNVWVNRRPQVDSGVVLWWERDWVPDENWWVFDAAGRWLGTVRVPSELRVISVRRGRVAGLWRDADDVEHVQFFAVQRG